MQVEVCTDVIFKVVIAFCVPEKLHMDGFVRFYLHNDCVGDARLEILIIPNTQCKGVGTGRVR